MHKSASVKQEVEVGRMLSIFEASLADKIMSGHDTEKLFAHVSSL